MSDLALIWSRLAPNGTNLGLFKISFLFILAQGAKMNRKQILKSPRFFQFDDILAQLEDKSYILAIWLPLLLSCHPCHRDLHLCHILKFLWSLFIFICSSLSLEQSEVFLTWHNLKRPWSLINASVQMYWSDKKYQRDDKTLNFCLSN